MPVRAVGASLRHVTNPYDPYAAPRAAPPPAGPFIPDGGQTGWTIGDTLGAAGDSEAVESGTPWLEVATVTLLVASVVLALVPATEAFAPVPFGASIGYTFTLASLSLTLAPATGEALP